MRNGEDWSDATYAEAERAVGYPFKDRELMKTAFTHASYGAAYGVRDNERLEFLGDAVIELAVTEQLFRAERADEGTLTERRKQFVSRDALAAAEARLGLMRYLRYSGGESNLGGKTSSNLFEAVTGALFLEGGYAAAKRWLKKHIEEIAPENYRSLLQEYVQDRSKETPAYRTQPAGEGYLCTVQALGERAEGSGPSKKAAQTAAAEKLYLKLTERRSQ